MPLSRHLICIGLSYRTAPVALRECARCTLSQLLTARESSAQFSVIQEIALLSTCNRLELYAVVDTDTAGEDGVDDDAIADAQAERLMALWCDACQAEHTLLADHNYVLRGQEAHRHLCEVAAGLDSLVLGEPQILGQVTETFTDAIDAKAIGPLLTALFRSAIRVGKRAHNETAISSRPVSISSVAVATAEATLGPLAQRKAVVVGVGEMGVQALKTLQGRGVQDVVVVNRTVAKADVLAKRFGYRAAPLTALPALLADADLVLSATGAPAQILTGPLIEAARSQRGPEPLMLIDVAVPRDIDPDVRALDGVFLLDIDELNTTVDEALESRQEQIPRVNAIIEEETAAFHKTMSELEVEPVIADLRKRAEQIRQAELARTIRFLGEDVDPATLKHIQHLSRALVNKLLHEPTVALKKQATNGHAAEYASTVQDLFGLSEQNGAVR